MQQVTVTKYATTDGKLFDDATEAAVHQAVLDTADEINAYVTYATESPKQQARLRNALTTFVTWRASAKVKPADTTDAAPAAA